MAHNPCGICGVQVFDDDDAVQCDGKCGLWHHRECLGMTLDTYLNLSKECRDWVCRKCVIIKQEIKKECDQTHRLRSRESKMGKSSKVECKKLDFMTTSQKCIFCNTSDRDEIKYGPIYSYKTVITHYYCLLLSSNMEQNGRDSEGILGFLPQDITKEAKRGSKLYCSYCRCNGATLGCALSKCKVVFHLPCGLKHDTLHQFFGEFKSFCNKHRPVQKISEKILAESSKGAMCGICYEKVVPRPVHDTLWAPCCQKNGFFHRDCVQKLATSAGYFFKCPLCNNVDEFQKAMKNFGIFIPEQDASWERVPQAYQDLLVRHDTCDSVGCKCPSGRKTNVSGTRWELILCKFCGSQGVHIGCGRLKWKCPEFECDICTDTSHDAEEGNRTLNRDGDRHRLTGARRTSEVHSYTSDTRERERSSSESSEDMYPVEISNQIRRVVSPLPEHRPKTPPTHHEKSNHNRNERKLFSNSTVLDGKSRSIVIDDSDDEVEVVGETNTGCVKAKDGSTIKVVPVSNVQKRLRVEGDVRVMPDEIVDITNYRASAVKKPRLPSPLPYKEVVYRLPSSTIVSQPCSSTATTAPPPPTSFVMIDPATLRQQDIPPNAVVYRSVQPMVSLPQAPVQTPMQPQHVPMQQLEKQQSSRHKDAEHSDLSKHRTGSCNYLCSFHLQGNGKNASAGALKRNCRGRRGRRNSGCNYNRLNPSVMVSPLKIRVRGGHIEIICSRKDLSFGSMKRRASPLPYRPMKKIKVSTVQEKKKRGKKRKLSDATNDKIENPKPAEGKKRKSMGKGEDIATPPSTLNAEFTNSSSSVNLFKTLKLKLHYKSSPEPKKKPKQVRRKKQILEVWKCKRIDDYLTRCNKIPITIKDLDKPQELLDIDVCKSNDMIPPKLGKTHEFSGIDMCGTNCIIPTGNEKDKEHLSSDFCQNSHIMPPNLEEQKCLSRSSGDCASSVIIPPDLEEQKCLSSDDCGSSDIIPPDLEDQKCFRSDDCGSNDIIPPDLENQTCLSGDDCGSSDNIPPDLEDQKCFSSDDCGSNDVIPPDLVNEQECLNNNLCGSNEMMAVQTLLNDLIDNTFTEISCDTDYTGQNTCNVGYRNKTVLLDDSDDQFKNCETTANVFEIEITHTHKNPCVKNLENLLNSPLPTDHSENRGNNISSFKSTSMINKTNVATNESEFSSSDDKTVLSSSPLKSKLLLEELVFQSNGSVMDYKSVSPNVFKKKMLKKTNFNYSCKGIFPRIKLSRHIAPAESYCNYNKPSKKSKIGTNNVEGKEPFNKQENKHKKRYNKCSPSNSSKQKSIGGENIIDHYFSHLKKDTSALKNSLDTQEKDFGSSLHSLEEEHKTDLNIYNSSSPGKKPLVELQYSMLPFCSF